MIVNNQSDSIAIKAGTTVATANIRYILNINNPESELEQIQITHSPDQEELTTIKQTTDSTEHKCKLVSDSAILNRDPIPEEHDILKRKSTISDKKLIDKFHLDHLEQPVRTKVKKLILKYRPIWSEQPFDLGLHSCLLYTSPSPRD